ncbi:RNA pyrophosphohydrolase [Tistrella bauzanensis]|uniref:RNA pyrophosphohydrolase n=1 Tax=Tistrella arctica TaxID=3133430 RepID=A0ABU9YJP2_9PROT
MAANPADLPYRPCVGVMLLNPAREVFVGQRIDTTAEAWQMPQGGIDPGETPEVTAMRELAEEIGTNNARILAETPDWLTYDLPDELIGKVWGGRYRGQRQKWFAMEFLGGDDEINLQTAHPEFNRWRWLPARDLPSMIVPFKRDLYRQVLTAFSHLLP